MADYITLMGAEEVRRAGSQMGSAGEQMSRAAGYIDEALRRHERFLDDWLQRFEVVLARAVVWERAEAIRKEREK